MPRTPTVSAKPKQDPTPAFARQVIELYGGELAEVRFPDLDRAVLESARDELQHAQLEVERLEADLQAARNALDAEAGALNAKAERALAYAKIYAASDPELSARIAELTGKKKPPSAANSEPVARRGRRKKAALESELFSVEHGSNDAVLAEGH